MARDTAYAIALLHTERELYPQGSNAWDVLGEIHTACGELNEARRSCEGALARNPAERIRAQLAGIGR